jgi:hypothetical protein
VGCKYFCNISSVTNSAIQYSGTCTEVGCQCAGLESGDYCENDQGKDKSAAYASCFVSGLHVVVAVSGTILLAYVGIF